MIVTIADNKTATQLDIKNDECVVFYKIKLDNILKVKELMEPYNVDRS